MADTVFYHPQDAVRVDLDPNGSGVLAGATTMDLAATHGARIDDTSLPTILVFGDPEVGAYEAIIVTAVAGDEITCTRAALGTTAQAWPAGETLRVRTASVFVGQLIDALQTGWESAGCDVILGDIRAQGVFIAGTAPTTLTNAAGQVLLAAIDPTGGSEGNVIKHVGGVPTWSSGAGTGDVVGPGSATDNAVPRFDAATGKLLQGSGVLISDTDDLTVPGTLTLGTAPTVVSNANGTIKVAALDDTLVTRPGTLTANALVKGDGADGVTVTGVLIDASDNLTVPGLLKLGTTPVTINNAAGKVLLAAIDVTSAAAGETIVYNDSTGKAEWGSAAASGAVTGPGSSTLNAIPRWGGTGGDTIVDSGVTIDGSHNIFTAGAALASGQTTFALLDTTVTTLNVARAATTINMGANSGQTNVRHDLHVIGDGIFDAALNVAGALAANGAAITSDDATFALLNTGVTTLNIGGAATAVNIGAATGLTTIKNDAQIDGDLAVDEIDLKSGVMDISTATFASLFASALAVIIGPTSGLTTIRNGRLSLGSDMTMEPQADAGSNMQTSFQSADAAKGAIWRYHNQDSDGTDDNFVRLYRNGGPDEDTNWSAFEIGVIGGGAYVIRPNAAGTGGAQDITIQAGGLSPARIILKANGDLEFENLPTSDPGGTNKVWNDAGTLKIT